MFGKTAQVNPLQSRKQLLIAESELNRVLALQEGEAMFEGMRRMASRVKILSSVASAAALVAAGVSAFRRQKNTPGGSTTPWLQTILKAASVLSTLWVSFRPKRYRSRLI